MPSDFRAKTEPDGDIDAAPRRMALGSAFLASSGSRIDEEKLDPADNLEPRLFEGDLEPRTLRAGGR